MVIGPIAITRLENIMQHLSLLHLRFYGFFSGPKLRSRGIHALELPSSEAATGIKKVRSHGENIEAAMSQLQMRIIDRFATYKLF